MKHTVENNMKRKLLLDIKQNKLMWLKTKNNVSNKTEQTESIFIFSLFSRDQKCSHFFFTWLELTIKYFIYFMVIKQFWREKENYLLSLKDHFRSSSMISSYQEEPSSSLLLLLLVSWFGWVSWLNFENPLT